MAQGGVEVDKMKSFTSALLILALSVVVWAQPEITPTKFLNTDEPERMCNKYIRDQYGDLTIFTQPSAGALVNIKIDEYQSRCVYIFCDEPTHHLLLYALIDNDGHREPFSVKAYGRQIEEPFWVFEGGDETDSIIIPETPRDSVGCLDRPVDVAVSSWGRYYDKDDDRVFVLDQANHRVVMLHYDINQDSLIWLGSFGENILKMPTSIDYADYHDSNRNNDDIYVTDPGISKVLRFSARGVYETSYGGWGRGLASISYPTGVAVSTAEDLPNRIYVTDSHNHRVVRYISGTTGNIIAECQHIFPLVPWPLISSVDTDVEGNVYVANSFTNNITVLDPTLSQILMVYGELGYEPGQFDYPADIYIDGNEMQVCELFADSSGIQSFIIQPGLGKRTTETLPRSFQLYPNYPNPFNPSTTLKFDLPEEGAVHLVIYNILGQRVRTLVNQVLPAGRHGIVWDGRNQAGNIVSSGVYFCSLRTDNFFTSRKMILMK